MAEITIPLFGDPSSKNLTTGHYRMYGTVPWYVPDFVMPYLVDTSLDKTVEIQNFVIDGENWKADVIIHKNPIPVVLIVGGIIAAAIVGGIALTVTKIERIVELSPGAVSAVSLTGLGLMAWILFK
jgi:hypothetical protein